MLEVICERVSSFVRSVTLKWDISKCCIIGNIYINFIIKKKTYHIHFTTSNNPSFELCCIQKNEQIGK